MLFVGDEVLLVVSGTEPTLCTAALISPPGMSRVQRAQFYNHDLGSISCNVAARIGQNRPVLSPTFAYLPFPRGATLEVNEFDDINTTSFILLKSWSATSVTSVAITTALLTGNTVFTTQTGLPILTGDRVRLTSAADATNWVEGNVVTYSGATLTLTIDLYSGTGIHTDWAATPAPARIFAQYFA